MGDEPISIIVPIYNAEQYLHKCINSVIQQTYRQWELILVDDGSVDSSYNICQEYALKDRRIKFVHTENKGRVHARKTGMAIAVSDIIAFMDSDDWIEPEALQQMYMTMKCEKVECVAAGYIETSDFEEKLVLNKIQSGIYRGDGMVTQIIGKMLCFQDFFDMGIQPFLWNKLFRRHLIEETICEIDERIVVGEDVLNVYTAIMRARSICVINKGYYHYCIRFGSTMHTYRNERQEIENIQMQYEYLYRKFTKSEYSNILLPQMKRYILHHLLVRAIGSVADKGERGMFLPFEGVEENSKIVLYGAGGFGEGVYNYCHSSGKCKVVAWTDGNYKKYQTLGYPIEALEEGLKAEYDYIVIAIMNHAAVKQVKEKLVSYGVAVDKIKWLDVTGIEQKIRL